MDLVRTALVTGASMGIGEAFARQLAARGKDLVLVSRNEARLQELAGQLSEAYGVRVHVIAADLSLPGAAGQVWAETERLGIEVDLLINNAGVGKRGKFAELDHDVQAAMVRLNVNTPAELSRLYLPGMRARRRGGIINVASNAAFQPVPYMAVYAASKAFLLHFSEAVAEEVSADGIRVMALCPGATDTAFWNAAGTWEDKRHWMTSPEKVVTSGLRAFARGRVTFVPGLGYSLAAFCASRLGPRWLVRRIVGKLFG